MEELIERPEVDEYHFFDPDVGEEGPSFSPGKFFSSIGRRGLKATMKDRAMEPHSHLIGLLSIVLIMALGVGAILLF